jgi:hypothetical protein
MRLGKIACLLLSLKGVWAMLMPHAGDSVSNGAKRLIPLVLEEPISQRAMRTLPFF